MSKTTTKYKGVYKNTTNGMYYYATKVKQDDGSYKSVKSKSTYQTAIQCYSDLLALKEPTKEQESVIQITPKKDNRKPFKEVALDWLDTYKLKNKESSSYLCEFKLYKYIIPLYENLSINFACETKSLVEFKRYLKNTSITTPYRNSIIGIFTNICQFAFYSDYISQQELGLVKLTLVPFSSNSEVAPRITKKREKFFYTLSEFNDFISKINDQRLNTIYQLLFYGGFRIGELLALQVKDFDYNNRTIKVSKTINIKGNTTTPKTSNSIREVYLKKSVCDALKNYIVIKKLNSNDTIFKLHYTTFRNLTKDIAEKIGMDYLNPHGFRHSCCSMLFETYKKHNIAIDFKQVADFLGDKVETILEVYYHLYGDANCKIVDLLE